MHLYRYFYNLALPLVVGKIRNYWESRTKEISTYQSKKIINIRAQAEILPLSLCVSVYVWVVVWECAGGAGGGGFLAVRIVYTSQPLSLSLESVPPVL